MPYTTIRYEPERLYEEVWAEPVWTVAKAWDPGDPAEA